LTSFNKPHGTTVYGWWRALTAGWMERRGPSDKYSTGRAITEANFSSCAFIIPPVVKEHTAAQSNRPTYVKYIEDPNEITHSYKIYTIYTLYTLYTIYEPYNLNNLYNLQVTIYIILYNL
jgi:hypothetical protein